MSSRVMRALLVGVIVMLVTGAVQAQESASYRLDEHRFNAGGRPEAGLIATSSSYRMTLDAIGEEVVGSGLDSGSYRMDSGFVTAYRPPGEVTGLRFTGPETFTWDPEPSVGLYNLYRDQLSALSSLGYGQCEQFGIASEEASDTDQPAVGDGYFYLVTAKNRLDEEGTKGSDGSGAERPNTNPCP